MSKTTKGTIYRLKSVFFRIENIYFCIKISKTLIINNLDKKGSLTYCQTALCSKGYPLSIRPFYHRIRAEPHVKPLPKAAKHTKSPGLIAPAS